MRTHATACIVGLLLTCSGAVALDIDEVLDSFATTQDRLKSFTFKSETSEQSNKSYSGTHKWYPKEASGKFEQFYSVEVRSDGDRFALRKETWGNVRPDTRDAPPGVKGYTSHLYDGQHHYQLNNGLTVDQAKVVLHQNDKPYSSDTWLHNTTPDRELFGAFYGDQKPMDEILREASDVSMRPETEDMSGTPCYVIDATTKYGQYTVWFDPSHGFNMAAAEVNRRPGDEYFEGGWQVEEGQEFKDSFQCTRFEQVDGAWVPMEVDAEFSVSFENGDYSNRKKHCERTEILLDPDHDALGSFLPDDIADGSLVVIAGVGGLSYTWHEGELKPRIDEDALEGIDQEIAKLIGDEAVSDHAGDAAVTVSMLLAQYRQSQNRIGGLIAKSKSQIDNVPSGQVSHEESEFRTDGERINLRARRWIEPDQSEQSAYASLLWDREQLLEYEKPGNGGQSQVLLAEDAAGKTKALAAAYRGAALLGLCPGETQRIDKILAGAKQASVRPEPVQVDGSTCHVIDASTATATYTVWIDAGHGHNIARIAIKAQDRTFALENVVFERKAAVWVPMKADMRLTQKGQVSQWRHTRTQIVLNADTEALGPFLADDIEDGTRVTISGDSGEYVWHDGKPVAATG